MPQLIRVVMGLAAAATIAAVGRPNPPPCDPGNAGLILPPGFCATLFGEGLGSPRNVTVLPNGDVVAARQRGGAVLLRDTTGDGHADIVDYFGNDPATGIAYARGWLYLGADDRILRWKWTPGQQVPEAAPVVVARGLPADGDHGAKPIVVRNGTVYVDLGSATNSCQVDNRRPRSRGIDPCTELDIRAGIWTFAAGGTDQVPAAGHRFATGLRNAEAFAFEPTTGTMWMAVHGRDQLGDNWGFSDSLNAELPAEEFGPVPAGADYGWPYCYYDELQGKKVTAPEYGGDGRRTGRCAGKALPVIGFPGHWAPMSLAFYDGTAFPPEYRGGAFLAFHGSWNRAPLPQAGFRVVYIPFTGGKATGAFRTFATARPGVTFRPSGLAVGPDGALYIASDAAGKIWRVVATGQGTPRPGNEQGRQ
ncbi:MAG TPA: PQQ-dependent sugar dehydrogenase [Gemmatimonadales bacterium]|nr:PQQ-dependent sugar dehydrogenase [Gemmatimonadales bacterium]